MLMFMTLVTAPVHVAGVVTNTQSSMAAKLRHVKVLRLGLRFSQAVSLHRASIAALSTTSKENTVQQLVKEMA